METLPKKIIGIVFGVFVLLGCENSITLAGLGEGVDVVPPTVVITYPSDNGLTFRTNDPANPLILQGTWNDNIENKAVTIRVKWLEGPSTVDAVQSGKTWSVNLGQFSLPTAGAQNFEVKITDASGNEQYATRYILIDNGNLFPVDTGSLEPNGWYRAGQTIPLRITFNKVALVTGSPRLKLNSASSRYAEYVSGSGTSILVFNYIVQALDSAPESAELNYSGTDALELNGGTIKDNTAVEAVLSLPAVDGAGSLGNNKNFWIDTSAPTVAGVSAASSNGYYRSGNTLSITITLSEKVFVVGSPSLALNIPSRTAVYSSGSGTNVLTLNYTVENGDASADLDYAATGSLSAGTSILDEAGNAAVLTLPAPGAAGSLGANKALVVDALSPVAPSLVGLVAGTYNTSKSFTLSGEGGAALEYSLDGGGSWTAYSGAVNLLTSGIYNIRARQTDAAGNVSPVSANVLVVIDLVNPVVTNVYSTTSDGYYRAGQTIEISVDFNKTVTVTGSPRIELNSGAPVYANYSGGTGTYTLKFTYTIGAAATSADLDYQNTTALELNSGTIKDGSGFNAILTLPAPGTNGSLGFNKDLVVDTTAPAVSSVTSSTLNGSYKQGNAIQASVSFNEAVVVTGSPQLRVNSNAGTPRYALYSYGSGTVVLALTYVVGSGDNSGDLDAFDTASLAGTITDAAGNAAALTLPALGGASSISGTKAIIIDTSAPLAPVVSGVSAGSFNTDQAFTVSGEAGATIEYSTNGGLIWNTYSGLVTISSNGSYSVLARQTDLAGNSGPASAAISFNIDKGVPTVTNVSSNNPNGEYKEGDTLDINVEFSKVVTVVGGSPTLTLNTSPSRTATYQSGSGSNSLVFRYIVQVGDTSNDLNYSATNSLALAGATIRDSVNNNATLTLPALAAAGSLGTNKNIKVDGVTPTISTFSPLHNTMNVSVGSNIVLTFNEAVYRETGTITIRRLYKRFPLVISVTDYNEYRSRMSAGNQTVLDAGYSLTTNGAVGDTPNTTGVYVLDYALDPDDAQLLTAFDSIGYNNIVIDTQSTQVTGNGTSTITINPAVNLPTGIHYYLEISAGAFRDSVGHNYAGISGDSIYRFTTGPVAAPVIRVNKTSGSEASQPTETQVKISSESEGASIQYTTSSSTPTGSNPGLPSAPAVPTGASTLYAGALTIGTTGTNVGYIYRLSTIATLASLSNSAVSSEIAFKTVLSTNTNDTNHIWYRGSNNSGGPTTAPGFPLRWEDNQYTFIKLGAEDTDPDPDRWYWITWEINVFTEYKALIGTKPGDWATKGPGTYGWESGSNKQVKPGGYSNNTPGGFEAVNAHTRP